MPARRWIALPVLFTLLSILPSTAAAQARWRLSEDLRIGEAADGPASFNAIQDIQVDAKGRILVLDRQTQEIRMFGPDGAFIRLVGRVGGGPGEYRETNGLRIAPDGRIWVNDYENNRLTVFTADGEADEEILAPQWGFGGVWTAMFDGQGRFLENIPARGATPPGHLMFRRFDPKSAHWDSVTARSCPPPDGGVDDIVWRWRTAHGGGGTVIPFVPISATGLDPSGAFLCAAGDGYRVDGYQLGSEQVAISFRGRDQRAPIPPIDSRRRDHPTPEVCGRAWRS